MIINVCDVWLLKVGDMFYMKNEFVELFVGIRLVKLMVF